jgi:hypothetical protein
LLRVTIQSAAFQTRQDIARITFCIPFARFPAEISGTHKKKAGESSLRVSMTRPSERGPAQKWNSSREEGLEFPEYLKSKDFDLLIPFLLEVRTTSFALEIRPMKECCRTSRFARWGGFCR